MTTNAIGYIVCGDGRPLHWLEGDLRFRYADAEHYPATIFKTHEQAIRAAARSDPEEFFRVYLVGLPQSPV